MLLKKSGPFRDRMLNKTNLYSFQEIKGMVIK
jgi:hypothetical protein